LLRKAGDEAHAAVAGRHNQEDARQLADHLGVGRVIDDEREAEDVADDDRI
jgi:predicted RecB family endonuclease